MSIFLNNFKLLTIIQKKVSGQFEGGLTQRVLQYLHSGSFKSNETIKV